MRTVLDTAYQVVDPETGRKSFHGILIDISDRKPSSGQLLQAALRDPLTGCYNRRYLMDRERDLTRSNQGWGVSSSTSTISSSTTTNMATTPAIAFSVRVARYPGVDESSEDAVLRIGGDEFMLLFGRRGGRQVRKGSPCGCASRARRSARLAFVRVGVARGRETLEDRSIAPISI